MQRLCAIMNINKVQLAGGEAPLTPVGSPVRGGQVYFSGKVLIYLTPALQTRSILAQIQGNPDRAGVRATPDSGRTRKRQQRARRVCIYHKMA